MLDLKQITLSGSRLYLEPLAEDYRNDLYLAAQEEKIWTYTSTKAHGENFHKWFDKALQKQRKGEQLAFIVRQKKDKKIIGSTRFYDIYPEHYRLAIGYTWYISEVWGTHVNPECKYLLLQYAFEILNMNRVEFYSDARNLRSRAAIKKLGANEEGVLRHHMILEDNVIRDTVIFSIIKTEWAQVKEKLTQRLVVLTDG